MEDGAITIIVWLPKNLQDVVKCQTAVIDVLPRFADTGVDYPAVYAASIDDPSHLYAFHMIIHHVPIHPSIN